jgi:hypothetical protein
LKRFVQETLDQVKEMEKEGDGGEESMVQGYSEVLAANKELIELYDKISEEDEVKVPVMN